MVEVEPDRGIGTMKEKEPSFFLHRNITVQLYSIKETDDDMSDCKKAYPLLEKILGGTASMFGGDHRLNRFFERFVQESGQPKSVEEVYQLIKEHDAKNLQFLIESYGAENLAVYITDRSLTGNSPKTK